jgi:hypothetical protein
MQTELETEIDEVLSQTDRQSAAKALIPSKREVEKSFFQRNRHAIWRLIVIAALTLGFGVILMPIAACL